MTKWDAAPILGEFLVLGGVLAIVYGLSSLFCPSWVWVVVGIVSFIAGIVEAS